MSCTGVQYGAMGLTRVDASTLSTERLVESACTTAGLEDFGDPRWRDGLDRLLDALRYEAALNDLGVAAASKEIKHQLINRLGVVAYRRSHPDVASSDVVPPIVIVGQARTGTTILHDLLAQDRAARVPLTWEVERPCPPPEAP